MNKIRKRKQNSDTALKQLTNECANYDRNSNNITHYCNLETTETNQCIYFIKLDSDSESEESRCTYFEEAVLPLNKVLMAEYYDKHSIQTDMHYNKCENRKCKKLFLTPAKKDLFCSSECKEEAARLLAKERKKENN